MLFNKDIYITSFLSFAKNIWVFIYTFIFAELTSKTINSATAYDSYGVLKYSLIFFSILFISKIVDLFLGIYTEKRLLKSKQGYKEHLYELMFKQRVYVIESLGLGNIKERLNDDTNITFSFITENIPSIITGFFVAFGYVLYISRINLYLGLFLVLISFLQLIPPFVVKRWLIENYEDTRDIESQLTEHILEGYTGLSTIKQFNAESFYMERLRNLHKDYYKIGKKSEVTAQFETALDKAISSILTYVTYCIIGLFLFKGSITLESAIATIVLVKGFYHGVGSIFSGLPKYFLFSKAMERLKDLIPKDEKALPNDFHDDFPLFKINSLSYGYGDKILMNDLNVSLYPNYKYAVIGDNGSGKSTLIKILSGVNRNYKGEVLYRGCDIKKLSDFEIFSIIEYLPQEDPILDLTPKSLYMMLCEGDDVSLNEILNTASILGLDENILNEQNISELSGGQRKKVFLSVTLCSKRKVLILDEPTNALDLESQNCLLSTIKNSNKSIIMITHNREFIDCCDFVLNISKGGVIV